MATINRQGDKYRVRIRIHCKSVSRTFPSLQEARRWAKKTEGAILAGDWQDAPAIPVPTLALALDRYAEEVTPTKRSADKEVSAIRALRQAVAAYRRLPLNEINEGAIAQVRDDLLRQGLAGASVRRYLATLGHVFTVARLDWGFEGVRNPVLNVRQPAPAPGRERRISTDEFQAVIAATESREMPLLAQLALATAARRGELCQLLRQDVDLAARTARFRLTKNGRDRVIPLVPQALEALGEAIATVPAPTDGRVFSMTPDALSRAWARAVARARAAYEAACAKRGEAADAGYLADLRWHDLRHERTSQLFDAGLSPIEVASVTGHSGAAMLARYAHADPQRLAQKLAVLV